MRSSVSIKHRAEELYLLVCDVLDIPVGIASESQKLMLYIVASELLHRGSESEVRVKDYAVNKRYFGGYDIGLGEQFDIPPDASYWHQRLAINAGAVARINTKTVLEKVVTAQIIVSDFLLRIMLSAELEAILPVDNRVISLVKKSSLLRREYSGWIEAMSRHEFNTLVESLAVQHAGPAEFSEAISGLYCDHDASRVASHSAVLKDLVNALAPTALAANAVLLIIDRFAGGQHLPLMVEGSVKFCGSVRRMYIELCQSIAPASAPVSDLKRRKQAAEFKKSPLKKLITDEVIRRLRDASNSGLKKIDKVEFEDEIAADFAELDDEMNDLHAYRRLVKVSLSLAYVAFGLYKKRGGWSTDSSGKQWIHLGSAHGRRPGFDIPIQ